MKESESLEQALRDGAGADAVLTDPHELTHYGTDRCRGGWPVQPSCVVLPRSVAAVQGVVRACAEHGVAIVPSGGRTGLAGAATATSGEVVLSLERMRRVLEVDPVAHTLRCEAGVTVQAVHEAAAHEGLMYPIDFASKGSAQIGGSISTNAGGVKVLRYGLTRNWVLGLRVVVASGEVLELGGSLVKNNTGYDLRQLFIGAEGTLGVIVEATLQLCVPPDGTVVALCAVPHDDQMLELFARVNMSGQALAAFECFDRASLKHVRAHHGTEGAGPFDPPSFQHALCEVEVVGRDPTAFEAATDALAATLADAQEAGEITDAVMAATPQQARDLWALRENISEALHRHTPHKADISLPVSRVAEFLAAWRPLVAEALPGIESVVFGHVGDGNLHLNLLRPSDMAHDQFLERCHAFDDAKYELVRDKGGSISAEHGVGLLKREHLHYSRTPAEVEMMRAIKVALDPGSLFNPGKIF